MTGAPTVSARRLSVGHEGETVVADIDLRLEPGQILALVGSNGSGKTTLLRTVAGLLAPTSGSLEVFGAKPLARPGRVAFLGQFHPTSFMLPMRAIDVVRMARFAAHGLFGRLTKADERVVHEAIEAMGVTELIREPLNALSGGQRQRIFLAQTFAREADLILMDEPAANLDATARETYRKLLLEASSQGRSAIVTTHDIDEAAVYHQTMLLAQRVVAYGRAADILTPETLLSTFGIVGRYKEGRIVVLEREHGCGEEPEAPGAARSHSHRHDHADHRH